MGVCSSRLYQSVCPPCSRVVLGKSIDKLQLPSSTSTVSIHNHSGNKNISLSQQSTNSNIYKENLVNKGVTVNSNESINMNEGSTTTKKSTEDGVAHVFGGGSFKAIGSAVHSYLMKEQWE